MEISNLRVELNSCESGNLCPSHDRSELREEKKDYDVHGSCRKVLLMYELGECSLSYDYSLFQRRLAQRKYLKEASKRVRENDI